MMLLLACVFYTASEKDADGDGHLGLAFEGDDCEDQDPAVHPGADELCNERDDDCDGTIDEDAVDTHTILIDGDGDGWGDASVMGCGVGVDQGGDCDDTDPTINPAAVDDLCTELDEDCDGVGSPLLTDPLARYGGEAGGTSGLGSDIAIGTPGNAGEMIAAASANAGTVLLFDPDNGAMQDGDARWARITGAGEHVMVGNAWPQDADEDDDIVVSDSTWSDGTGRVSVLQLPPGGGDMDVEEASVHYVGGDPGDRLGASLAMRYNPGGTTTLIVGAPGTNGETGAAYILPFESYSSGVHLITESGYPFTTSNPNARLGSSVAVWTDAAGIWWGFTGAPGWDGRYGTAGAVFACQYGSGGDITTCGSWVGDHAGDGFGAVLALGDVNGNGLDDLLVGAPDADWDGTTDAGAVWVILDDHMGSGNQLDTDDSSFLVGGSVPGQALGRSMAVVDGLMYIGGNDVACTDTDAGAVYSIDGSGGGIVTLDASATFRSGAEGEAIGGALLPGEDGTLWVGAPGGGWVGLFPTR